MTYKMRENAMKLLCSNDETSVGTGLQLIGSYNNEQELIDEANEESSHWYIRANGKIIFIGPNTWEKFIKDVSIIIRCAVNDLKATITITEPQ